MRTLKLTLAYDGTEYSGWQYQPDRPTLQGDDPDDDPDVMWLAMELESLERNQAAAP